MALVFIVEDDNDIRQIEAYALKCGGFEIEEFEDAKALYERLEKKTPDLFLLDVMLPDEDGLEIVKKLRAMPQTKHLPVMMVTAKTTELDKVRGLDIGADDYMTKPFGIMELLSRVKALLRRRVKPSRYVHSVMVAETAEKMAQAYDVDPRVARMAGLLHDWDKALSPKRLRDRIATYGLDIDGPTQINMPQLLHGPTAAAVLADEFPEFGEEVFQAIERHTVGSIRMSALDMIVFCADKLEPGNDVQVYRDLYDKIGKMSLEDLFCAVEREGFMYLLRSSRPLNIDAVEVWNFYCAERQRDNE